MRHLKNRLKPRRRLVLLMIRSPSSAYIFFSCFAARHASIPLARLLSVQESSYFPAATRSEDRPCRTTLSLSVWMVFLGQVIDNPLVSLGRYTRILRHILAASAFHWIAK